MGDVIGIFSREHLVELDEAQQGSGTRVSLAMGIEAFVDDHLSVLASTVNAMPDASTPERFWAYVADVKAQVAGWPDP